MSLRWTRVGVRPTAPGFYFLDNTAVRQHERFPLVIKEVGPSPYGDKPGLGHLEDSDEGLAWVPVLLPCFDACRWAGPIPVPEEPPPDYRPAGCRCGPWPMIGHEDTCPLSRAGSKAPEAS